MSTTPKAVSRPAIELPPKPRLQRGLRINLKYSTAAGAWICFFAIRPEEVTAGCPVRSQPLGSDVAGAVKKAREELLPKLNAWRRRRKMASSATPADKAENAPAIGTLDWMIDFFKTTRVAEQMDPDAFKNRLWHLRELAKFEIEDGITLGSTHTSEIDAESVEDIYRELLWTNKKDKKRGGTKRVTRRTTANRIMRYARGMWNETRRQKPAIVTTVNPFSKMNLKDKWNKLPGCTYQEFTLVVDALLRENENCLAAACMIIWEWLQRPGHVFRHMKCEDFRLQGRSNFCRVEHPKNDTMVEWPLAWRLDGEKEPFRLTPELERALTAIKGDRTDGLLLYRDRVLASTGKFVPWSVKGARRRISEVMARTLTRDNLTMRNIRYGGYTEVGAAELTEIQIDQIGGRASASVNVRYADRSATVIAKAQRQRLKERSMASANDDLLFDAAANG